MATLESKDRDIAPHCYVTELAFSPDLDSKILKHKKSF